MADEKKTEALPPPISSTDLALERTVLAHERTLMAWVRTATSLISFGFTLYKFFEESAKAGNTNVIFTPRRVGMIMILFGLIGLLLAQIQHYQAIKRLRKSYPAAPKSVASVLGILVLLFGVAMFLGALFRQ
jgi:putative membrane protein